MDMQYLSMHQPVLEHDITAALGRSRLTKHA